MERHVHTAQHRDHFFRRAFDVEGGADHLVIVGEKRELVDVVQSRERRHDRRKVTPPMDDNCHSDATCDSERS